MKLIYVNSATKHWFLYVLKESNDCAKNKQIEELRRWSMKQNELMKKEKKHSMIERSSFSWRRSSFTEICNANRVTLFKSEATDWLIVIWSHLHYLSHQFFVRFICARCSLSRYKYLESIEHRWVQWLTHILLHCFYTC